MTADLVACGLRITEADSRAFLAYCISDTGIVAEPLRVLQLPWVDPEPEPGAYALPTLQERRRPNAKGPRGRQKW